MMNQGATIIEQFVHFIEGIPGVGALDPRATVVIKEGRKGRLWRRGESSDCDDIQWSLDLGGRGIVTVWDRGGSTFHFTAVGVAPETPEQSAKRETAYRAECERKERAGTKTTKNLLAQSTPANASHGYLKRKGIGPEYLREHEGCLIVPILKSDGELVSAQRIFADGKKQYLRDIPLRPGHHALIPGSKAWVIVAEGWATAKSVHEATKGLVTVVVAMSASNMTAAAKVAAATYPDARFLIAGDADEVGRAEAERARKALSDLRRTVVAAFPVFPEDQKTATDFNDLAGIKGKGKSEVARQIKEASKRLPAVATGQFSPTLKSISQLMASKAPPMVIDNLLPVGLTVFGGAPKTGKSLLALDLVAAKASGGMFLGGIPVGDAGDAMYLALDNDADWRIKERLLQLHGGDESRMVQALDGKLGIYCDAWERGNFDALRTLLDQMPKARVVVIDVLLNVQRGRHRDESLYSYDYGAIQPLSAIANERGIAIVGVTHTNKRQEVSSEIEKITGSTGVTGGASSVWVLSRTKEGKDKRVLTMTGRDIQEREISLRLDSIWS